MRINGPHLEPCESVFDFEPLDSNDISSKLLHESLSGTNIFHGLVKGQLIYRTVFDFFDLVFGSNEDEMTFSSWYSERLRPRLHLLSKCTDLEMLDQPACSLPESIQAL